MGHPYYMETRAIEVGSVIGKCMECREKGGSRLTLSLVDMFHHTQLKRKTLEEDFIPLARFPDNYPGRLASVGNRL